MAPQNGVVTHEPLAKKFFRKSRLWRQHVGLFLFSDAGSLWLGLNLARSRALSFNAGNFILRNFDPGFFIRLVVE